MADIMRARVDLYLQSGREPKVWSGTLQQFFKDNAELTSATPVQVITVLKDRGEVIFGGGAASAFKLVLPSWKQYSEGVARLRKMVESDVTLSTDLFGFDKKDGVFSQEVSSLPGFSGLMTDKIRLKNPKTGRSIEFEYGKRLTTGSGEDQETAGWEYYPVVKFPGVTKIVIFND